MINTQYTWDFGDNSPPKQFTGFTNASHVTHNYYTPNTYIVTLTAVDNGGQGVAQTEVKVLGEQICCVGKRSVCDAVLCWFALQIK